MKLKLVNEWYSVEKNIDEMPKGTDGRLKIWEEKVLAYFPEGSSVLDIGCGMGREAFALCNKGYKVTGIDVSTPIIEKVKKQAEENGYKIPFFHYDGFKIPFIDKTFDVVIIWAQTFGLLYGEEYKISFLKECYRVLKDGGVFSFSGHDYEYEKEHYLQYTDGRKFYPYANTELYWETFTTDELNEYAVNAGFAVITYGYGEIYKPEDGVILHCVCRK